MKSRICRILNSARLAAGLALGALVTAQAGGPPTGAPGVFPPESQPYGKTYAEYQSFAQGLLRVGLPEVDEMAVAAGLAVPIGLSGLVPLAWTPLVDGLLLGAVAAGCLWILLTIIAAVKTSVSGSTAAAMVIGIGSLFASELRAAEEPRSRSGLRPDAVGTDPYVRDHATQVDVHDEKRAAARARHLDLGFELRHSVLLDSILPASPASPGQPDGFAVRAPSSHLEPRHLFALRREAPTEPFKRAVTGCLRAIASWYCRSVR